MKRVIDTVEACIETVHRLQTHMSPCGPSSLSMSAYAQRGAFVTLKYCGRQPYMPSSAWTAPERHCGNFSIRTAYMRRAISPAPHRGLHGKSRTSNINGRLCADGSGFCATDQSSSSQAAQIRDATAAGSRPGILQQTTGCSHRDGRATSMNYLQRDERQVLRERRRQVDAQ